MGVAILEAREGLFATSISFEDEVGVERLVAELERVSVARGETVRLGVSTTSDLVEMEGISALGASTMLGLSDLEGN